MTAPDLDIVADLFRPPDTAPANAEPQAGPNMPDPGPADIAEWLTWASDSDNLDSVHWAKLSGRMTQAAKEVAALRAANARLADAANAETGRRLIEANALRAHNTRLSAELDAARGKEGR